MQFLKRNATLFLGFLVPVLMVLFIAGSIYIPRLFYHPQYDFLYSTGGQTFSVENGVLSAGRPDSDPSRAPHLYRYDVRLNAAREITAAEAATLTLDSRSESPDGFSLTYGSGGAGMFPFFYSSSDYATRYLVGHGTSLKVNADFGNGYYSEGRFVGWIIR